MPDGCRRAGRAAVLGGRLVRRRCSSTHGHYGQTWTRRSDGSRRTCTQALSRLSVPPNARRRYRTPSRALVDHQQRPLCLGPMPAPAEDDEFATRRPLTRRYRPPQPPRTALIWPPLMTRAVRGRRTRQSPDGPWQHLSALTAFPWSLERALQSGCRALRG